MQAEQDPEFSTAQDEEDGVPLPSKEDFADSLVNMDDKILPQELGDLKEKISDLGENYLDWVEENLEAISDTLMAAQFNKDKSYAYLNQIEKKANSICDVGSGFQYPLLASAANSLEHYVNNVGRFNDDTVEIISAHIRGMRVIMKKKLAGHGGVGGRKLVYRLECAVEASLRGPNAI